MKKLLIVIKSDLYFLIRFYAVLSLIMTLRECLGQKKGLVYRLYSGPIKNCYILTYVIVKSSLIYCVCLVFFNLNYSNKKGIYTIGKAYKYAFLY